MFWKANSISYNFTIHKNSRKNHLGAQTIQTLRGQNAPAFCPTIPLSTILTITQYRDLQINHKNTLQKLDSQGYNLGIYSKVQFGFQVLANRPTRLVIRYLELWNSNSNLRFTSETQSNKPGKFPINYHSYPTSSRT